MQKISVGIYLDFMNCSLCSVPFLVECKIIFFPISGNVPKYILDKMPVMLGVDDPVSTPLPQNYGESEGETPGERKRRRRRSLGGRLIIHITSLLNLPLIYGDNHGKNTVQWYYIWRSKGKSNISF